MRSTLVPQNDPVQGFSVFAGLSLTLLDKPTFSLVQTPRRPILPIQKAVGFVGRVDL